MRVVPLVVVVNVFRIVGFAMRNRAREPLLVALLVAGMGCEQRDKHLDVERVTLVRQIEEIEAKRDALIDELVKIDAKERAFGDPFAKRNFSDEEIALSEAYVRTRSKLDPLSHRSAELRARVADIERIQPARPEDPKPRAPSPQHKMLWLRFVEDLKRDVPEGKPAPCIACE